MNHMPSKAIELHDVSFTYWEAEEPSLRDINLEVEVGQFVLITGPTGAGKSTFLMLLNGLIPHLLHGKLTGKVLINGQDTKTKTVPELATQVGMTFEDPDTQIVSLTVEDDVAFGPSNSGIGRDEINRRVQDALLRTRLCGMGERNPFTLSGGQKQGLAIAGVLAMNPKILVLDEPLSMLDPVGRAMVVEILKDLVENSGSTVIVAEQNPEPFLELADRIMVFDRGQVIKDGPIREVFKDVAKLSEIGVKLPPVVELFQGLRNSGYFLNDFPLTVKEAASLLKPFLLGTHPVIAMTSNNEKQDDAKPIIVTSNVQHRYNESVLALQGVDLEIQANTITAILGQNGCGKTTLAKHLINVLSPTNPEAKIVVAGLDVSQISQRQLLEHINYVFQNPDDQLFQDSVESEIAYGPRNMGLGKEQIDKNVDLALKFFSLANFREIPPKQLERGLRTKTTIASVVAMDPTILIIDEPTTGLDILDSITIFEILQQLVEIGKTIVFISHEMDFVARFAQQVVVMHEGEIVLQGTPAKIFAEEEKLQHLSLIPPDIHRLCLALGWPLWDSLRTPADLAQAILDALKKETMDAI
jgi:energy-coupling factor transport system ATP-binding protein